MAAADFKHLIGQKLDRVARSVHRYQGADIAPVALWLDFGGTPLRLRVAGRGEGLDVFPEPIDEGFDMAQYGEVAINDASDDEPFVSAVGKVLRSARDIRVGRQSEPIGLVLRFQPSGQLFLAGWGDELLYAVDYPPDVLAASPTES